MVLYPAATCFDCEMMDVLLNRSDPCDDLAGCVREREVTCGAERREEEFCGAERREEEFCVVGFCGERGNPDRSSCLRSFKLDW